MKCFICNRSTHEKIIPFSGREDAFKKCELLLTFRKLKKNKYQDISLDFNDLNHNGYHHSCYKRFMSVPVNHREEFTNWMQSSDLNASTSAAIENNRPELTTAKNHPSELPTTNNLPRQQSENRQQTATLSSEQEDEQSFRQSQSPKLRRPEIGGRRFSEAIRSSSRFRNRRLTLGCHNSDSNASNASVEDNQPELTTANNHPSELPTSNNIPQQESENLQQTATLSSEQEDEHSFRQSQSPKLRRPEKCGRRFREATRSSSSFCNGMLTHGCHNVCKFEKICSDKFSTYGQHIANKLRYYPVKLEMIVENAINNLLFEADMGNYDAFQS